MPNDKDVLASVDVMVNIIVSISKRAYKVARTMMNGWRIT
jgi:hypothetical protein